MAKLKAALTAVKEKLVPNEALLARARRRYKANRKRAFEAHELQLHVQQKTDGAPASQKARLVREAHRHSEVALHNHNRAQVWLGRIKNLTQRIEGLEHDQASIEAEIKKLRPKVVGNWVIGGSAKQRWFAAWLTSVTNCANGTRRNFYSMSGAWNILKELVGGPNYGDRSDCSSTVTGEALAAGLPDPNGQDFKGGWTETLTSESNGWKRVSLEVMRKKGWGFIVYGPLGATHHTEGFIPTEANPDRTGGHGSQPVDFGTIFLFGTSEEQTYYIWQAPRKG